MVETFQQEQSKSCPNGLRFPGSLREPPSFPCYIILALVPSVVLKVAIIEEITTTFALVPLHRNSVTHNVLFRKVVLQLPEIVVAIRGKFVQICHHA